MLVCRLLWTTQIRNVYYIMSDNRRLKWTGSAAFAMIPRITFHRTHVITFRQTFLYFSQCFIYTGTWIRDLNASCYREFTLEINLGLKWEYKSNTVKVRMAVIVKTCDQNKTKHSCWVSHLVIHQTVREVAAWWARRRVLRYKPLSVSAPPVPNSEPDRSPNSYMPGLEVILYRVVRQTRSNLITLVWAQPSRQGSLR